jgi:hypothetical protein
LYDLTNMGYNVFLSYYSQIDIPFFLLTYEGVHSRLGY